MVKVKKEKLSLEELLEQTLIKEQDLPYKVPSNWVWIHWGACGNFVAGNGFKQTMQGFKDYNIPFYKVGSLKYSDTNGYLFDSTNTITEKMRKELKASIIPVNSLIFAKIGEAIRLNRRCINDKNCCIDNNLMSFSSNASVNIRYVYYWSCNQEFYNLANATTVPAIRKSDLEMISFPLPPLTEQQRIVEVIESLFEKLDIAKELIQNALDSFESRKAAILHKAFTGELTNKWREENGVSLEEWKEKTLKSLCKISSGGTPSRVNEEYYTGEIPWIKTGEITWNYINNSEEKITEDAIKNSSAKLFPKGTVLVAMYGQGMTRGRAAILDIEATTNQAVCALMPNQELLNKYLYYYFMCNYWRLREKAVGGNQPNFSGTIVGEFIINLPPLIEQKEIIRILDNIQENEQRAQELCDVIDKIDLMKKTILARAFRGELGTNNPEEESAVELLKEILKNKNL